VELRIGHLSTLYHTSMVLLAREEFLRGFPARITWRLFGTGPAIVEAMGRGEIDVAYIGLPPATIGISRGVPVVCVAGGHIEGTVIAGRKDAPGYPETSDLGEILERAGAIAVPGKGSIHDLILMDALESRGVKADVRNLPWADEVLESFMRGDVDAVVGTPALAQAVITFGGGKVLYPPERLWPDNPSYGILVTAEALDKERPLITEFLRRHETASEFLRTRAEAAARSIARVMGVVDEEFVRGTIAMSPHYCAALTGGFVRCAMELAGRLLGLGYMERPVASGEVFDFSLIKETHPGPDHYR
jgi:NitT/TauT family transport system substrate-binding protein